jgi:hypothetical protein
MAKINRKPTDKCLICGVNEATQKNSHIVPASLLTSMIGKRDKEHSILLEPSKAQVDEFFGRANLKNESTAIKQHHHTRNFYFCPECESNLGGLESKICPFVTRKLRDENYRSNIKEVKVNDVVIKELTKISPDDFNVFFLSIVLRQALRQIIDKRIFTLSQQECITIKEIVRSYLYGDSKIYKPLCDQFGLLIISSDGFKDASMNVEGIAPLKGSPKMFLVNEFWILLYYAKDFEESKKLSDPSTYFDFPPNPDCLNYPHMAPKVMMMPQDTWVSILTKWFNDLAEIYISCKKRKKRKVRRVKRRV